MLYFKLYTYVVEYNLDSCILLQKVTIITIFAIMI